MRVIFCIVAICVIASLRGVTTENSTLDYTYSYDETDDTYASEGSGEAWVPPTDDEDGFDGEYDDSEEYDPENTLYYDNEEVEDRKSFEWEGFDGIVCSNGNRIGKSKVCDGIPDCFDCSDEENCSDANSNVFMCYAKETSDPSRGYTFHNPKCIEMHKFCDGMPDCRNSADENYAGSGFKCVVKKRFRTCTLPENFICDGVAHCEDESDVCGHETDGVISAVGLRNSTEGSTSLQVAPDGFYQCLNTGEMISLDQLCDGRFDCKDLSDECICEVLRSNLTTEVCTSMCAKPIWPNQPSNRNCEFCNQGEIYWNTANAMIASNNSNMAKKICFTPEELWVIIDKEYSSDKGEKDGKSYEIIECYDLTLSNSMIRARKCDGRPECYFGEDECGIDCRDGGKKEWTVGSGEIDGDPDFCRLLEAELTGYSCLSWLNDDQKRKENLTAAEMVYFNRRISVCDGHIECEDGSDEAFCPTRLPCSIDVNDNTMENYDELQRCDGVEHCTNGIDEKNCTPSDFKILPCDVTVEGETQQYFHIKNLLDGRKQCDNGADECPPFLNKIKEIKNKVSEGVEKNPQIGISTHDRAIDNMGLQVFLIATAFIGISALAVSLALGLYNVTIAWLKFCRSGTKDRSLWIRNCLIYGREIVVNLGITVSKILICVYFAFIRIRRSEESNYSLVDLEWRSSFECSVAGALALIGTQTPIFILSTFAISYLLLRKCFSSPQKRKSSYSTAENGRDDIEHGANTGKPLDSKERICLKVALVTTCLVLLAFTWLPAITLALMLIYPSGLNARTQTYGWIRATGAPTLFRANLLSDKMASAFASTLVAIRNQSYTSPNPYFTYPELQGIADSIAPNLGIRVYSTYGYFAHSGTCLPGFLSHVSGGDAPFDIAVSNSWTWGLSVGILALDFGLIFITSALVSRYGAGVCKTFCCGPEGEPKERHSILNHTFSRLVLTEALTWLFIATLFFLKASVPDFVTDYTYTMFCVSVLGVNCGLVTPFVLLTRKFRLQNNKHSIVKSRAQSYRCSTRIIEVNAEDEEQKPLTKGKPMSDEQGGISEESRGLMKNGNGAMQE